MRKDPSTLSFSSPRLIQRRFQTFLSKQVSFIAVVYGDRVWKKFGSGINKSTLV